MNKRIGISLIALGASAALGWADAGTAASPDQATNTGAAAVPPGYSLTLTGNVRDFDFLAGAWTTVQRRLKARGVGSTEWNDAPANVHCAIRYLDGALTAEESYSPAGSVSGLFLYSFDIEKHQWSLYWIDPKTGKLESPLVGGFNGMRGDFYGDDVENGHPIKVRYSWIRKDRDHARWEQAFSFDNKSWETNWTTEFIRTDRATHCRKQDVE